MEQKREGWEDETSGLDGWEVEGSRQGIGSLWRLAAILQATWGWVLLGALMVIEFGELL
jgi:hypothetical protein